MSTQQQNVKGMGGLEAELAPLEGGLVAGAGGAEGAQPSEHAIGGIDVQPLGKLPKISSNTVLVACVVAVAGGVLWGMRFVGLGAGMALATPGLDRELEKFAARPTADHARVLADLQASRVEMQVNEESVKKNPFRLAGPPVPTNTGPDNSDAKRSAEAARQEEERRRRERTELLAKVDSVLNSLHLNAVVTGSVPAARINNRIFRVGDMVMGIFTLAKVHDRSIELEFEGRTFRVEMTGGEGLEGSGDPAAIP